MCKWNISVSRAVLLVNSTEEIEEHWHNASYFLGGGKMTSVVDLAGKKQPCCWDQKKNNFLWGIRKGDLLRNSYLIWLECHHQLPKELYEEGDPLSFSAIFTLFSEGFFFFVVSHQTQLGLNKISWGNPSTFGSHRSILCHSVGVASIKLIPQWKSTTLNSMVTPQLYANRIKCSLLQVSIMIKYSLSFFSNWDSL